MFNDKRSIIDLVSYVARSMSVPDPKSPPNISEMSPSVNVSINIDRAIDIDIDIDRDRYK